MKNFEKYIDEIIMLINPHFVEKIDKSFSNHMHCPHNCPICPSTCSYKSNKIKEWLLKKTKEPYKITNNEKVILESLPKNCNYMARNINGVLFIYEDMPKKLCTFWGNSNGYMICLPNQLFRFVNWEDKEPLCIKDILENCEVLER